MKKPIHNNYITIAKAIGIVLMVIGHSGCPQLLFRFVYLFHMPLFFFCSGIFFKEMTTKKESYLYLKKRIIGLYIPFVKWSVLFLLLHNLLMLVGIYNSYYGYESSSSYYTLADMLQKLFFILFTMHEYEELLGGFWFIRALFIASLLIFLFSLLIVKSFNYKYEMMCLFFLIMTIVIRRLAPDPEFWRDISMGSLGAFFYITGFLLNKYDSVWKNKKCAVVCCLILFLSFHYFKEGISMGCGFNKVLLFSCSAISGSVLTIYCSRLIEFRLRFVRDILYYIGNHTLAILALHFLAFRFVSCLIALFYGFDIAHIAEHPVIKDVPTINPSWCILYTIVGSSIPLLLNKVWHFFVSFIKEEIICK